MVTRGGFGCDPRRGAAGAQGALEASDRLELVTIPQSHLSIMYDQPEELDRVVSRFLERQES